MRLPSGAKKETLNGDREIFTRSAPAPVEKVTASRDCSMLTAGGVGKAPGQNAKSLLDRELPFGRVPTPHPIRHKPKHAARRSSTGKSQPFGKTFKAENFPEGLPPADGDYGLGVEKKESEKNRRCCA